MQASNSPVLRGIASWQRAVALAAVAMALSVSARADERAGAALLFSKAPGGLTKIEQVEIFQKLGLRVSPDGKGLTDEACGEPVTSEVQFPDMNSDRVSEVLVTYGNTCMSGMAGSSVALFIKDASGHYRSHLGFPGVVAEVLPSKNGGYPDLLIGGPGFCFAVWRWSGGEYAHFRDEPQSPGGCDHLKK